MLPLPELSPAVRVVVADDDARVVSSLRDLFATSAEMALVKTCASGAATLDAAVMASAELVVMDLGMPDGGPSLVRKLAERLPGVAVVVLTVKDDPGAASQMLDAGARGYLVKGASGENLLTSLRRVLSGEIVVQGVSRLSAD